jgi:hypothetical protein
MKEACIVPFDAHTSSDEVINLTVSSEHPLPRPAHQLRPAGEERFVVEWQSDDEVPVRQVHEGGFAGRVVVSLRS